MAAADRLEVFPGVAVPVAQRAHLIAQKVLAADPRTRPQDRIDALNLLREASQAEVAETRVALTLISARGYER